MTATCFLFINGKHLTNLWADL